MAQQTAVEWLFQKMTEQGTNPYWDMRFIQAKQMEKEQMEAAWNNGYKSCKDDIVTDNMTTFEQYINSTP